MKKKDPIQKLEGFIKSINDSAGKITQPVLHRYPILFAFLIIISVSAISHGLKDLIGEVEYFTHHPGILMLIGIVILILTGRLYLWLDKGSH